MQKKQKRPQQKSTKPKAGSLKLYAEEHSMAEEHHEQRFETNMK